jgi:hypothetical protein
MNTLCQHSGSQVPIMVSITLLDHQVQLDHTKFVSQQNSILRHIKRFQACRELPVLGKTECSPLGALDKMQTAWLPGRYKLPARARERQVDQRPAIRTQSSFECNALTPWVRCKLSTSRDKPSLVRHRDQRKQNEVHAIGK